MRAEVYDHTGEELVGYLEGVADLMRSRASHATIVVDEGSVGDPCLGSFSYAYEPAPYRPAEYVALEVGHISRRFERSLLIRDPHTFEAMIASVIPEHAESVEDIERDRITYHWKVLKLPKEPGIGEWVFELNEFEPEGKSCSAWAAEERWWAKLGHMPRQHRGGLASERFKAFEGARSAEQPADAGDEDPQGGALLRLAHRELHARDEAQGHGEDRRLLIDS